MRIDKLVAGIVLASLATAGLADAHPAPVLHGAGTAILDGSISQDEWSKAGTMAVNVRLPEAEGGGTLNGTLSVMNDLDTLYMALSLPGRAGTASIQILFDDDHDGEFYEQGEDAVVANSDPYGAHLYDDFFATCPDPDSVGCSNYDINDGGTSDGELAATNDSGGTMIEIGRAFDTGDPAHDITLAQGDTAGVYLYVTLLSSACSQGCYSDTFVSFDLEIEHLVLCSAVPNEATGTGDTSLDGPDGRLYANIDGSDDASAGASPGVFTESNGTAGLQTHEQNCLAEGAVTSVPADERVV
ncbi:MAG: hypothetical protein ABR548_12185 [Actinomycetota bacterium]|nr:hypothetical protein [Actinomycetota bacterium]